MRVYAKYSPFIQPEHDLAAEFAQWSLFFVLFAALLIRLNMDNESLQDKRYFDCILVVVNLAPFLIPVLQQVVRTEAAKGLKNRLMRRGVVKAVVLQALDFLGYGEVGEIGKEVEEVKSGLKKLLKKEKESDTENPVAMMSKKNEAKI